MSGETQDPVTLVGLINQLTEVADPPPVSMVPQTTGWLVLAIVLAIAICAVLWRVWRKYRANKYRRDALHALQSVGDDAGAISIILKRAALAAFPRSEVAALTGEAWLLFLDETMQARVFGTGAGSSMTRAAYGKADQTNVAGLNALAIRWVREHRRAEPDV